MVDFYVCFEFVQRVVGFVCIVCCPVVFPWSCIPGTLVCGPCPTNSPLQTFTISGTQNCPTLMTTRIYNINKNSSAFCAANFINVGVAGRPAGGVGRGGWQSYCVYGSVATVFDVARLAACQQCCWGPAHKSLANLKRIQKHVFIFGQTPVLGIGCHDSDSKPVFRRRRLPRPGKVRVADACQISKINICWHLTPWSGS